MSDGDSRAMSQLSGQAARGGFTTVLAQIIQLSIQIASVAVLSRLLSPGDFGLVAMCTVFVALGSLIRDFGIPTATLQAQRLTTAQASNLFWLSTALGIGCALILIAITPLVVLIYGDQRLWTLFPVMALTLIPGGFSAQLQVHLARSMRFQSLATLSILAPLFGVIAAISGALLGFGYWALAAQIVVSSVSLVIMQAVIARWIPSRPRRRVGTRPILESGLHFGGAQFLTFAAGNTDTLLIGARWGAVDLGYYNRAFQLLSMPMQAMLAPLTSVVVPVVNRAREEGRQSVDDVLLRVQFAVGFASVWVFLIATSSAQHSIPILLGPGWTETVVIFQILAVGGAVQVFSYVSYWGFIVHNQSRELLKYNVVTKTMTIAAVAVGSIFGVHGVAIAYALSLIVSWPINLIWLRRTSGQDSRRYLLGGLRMLSAALVGALATRGLLAVVGPIDSDLVGVLVTVCVSSVVFLVVIIVTPGGYADIKMALRMVASLAKKG